MVALSLVIDPGGIGGRPATNLQIFPDGNTPLRYISTATNPVYTTNRQIAADGFDDQIKFEFDCKLDLNDFSKLQALINYSKAQKYAIKQWEIVLYNLCVPYSETSEIRSRFRVPGTPNIIEESESAQLTRFSYWVAIQGQLSLLKANLQGSFYVCSLKFEESTKLTSDLEP